MGNQILGMTTLAQSQTQVSKDDKASIPGASGFPFYGHGEDLTKTHNGKPCRACTDFKSWARLQTLKRSNNDPSSSHSEADDRNTSFEDVRKTKQDTQSQSQLSKRLTPEEEEYEALLARRAHLQCPLDKDELGRSTWSFLHTMAAYYPDNPSKVQQKEMSAFMKIFAKYYPCEHCAQDFQKSIKEFPPETHSRDEFIQWMCKRHNEVNKKLGKEEFDCGKVDERWKDGWKDESCDM